MNGSCPNDDCDGDVIIVLLTRGVCNNENCPYYNVAFKL